MEHYTFRETKKEEIPALFRLILARMKWMDEVGIRQWNVTKYDEVYPPAYFEEKRQRGESFVLVDNHKAEIVAVGVLKTEDDRWTYDGESAVYLHNFATKIGTGAGHAFMHHAEQYARDTGKSYFRLDSASGNRKLAQYYENLGFVPVGSCVDGMYSGTLRQKKL